MSELTRKEALSLYSTMLLCRRIEERMINDMTSGKQLIVGHPTSGQEAVAVGVCAALRLSDHLYCSHRAKAWAIAKGVKTDRLMAEFWGKATGVANGRGGEMLMGDMDIGFAGSTPVVASNMPLACGSALAAKTKKTGAVAVCAFGDGGSNQGAFHESLNLSAIWKLPAVWVCENNGYAESTAVEYAIPVTDIAERANAYAIPGVVVDGQDVLAVYAVAKQAIERARAGEGPTLIEAKTYRYHGHFYGDNTKRYRSPEEEQQHKDRDCIEQMKQEALTRGLFTGDDCEEAELEVQKTVVAASEFAEQSPYPDIKTMFQDVYVKYP